MCFTVGMACTNFTYGQTDSIQAEFLNTLDTASKVTKPSVMIDLAKYLRSSDPKQSLKWLDSAETIVPKTDNQKSLAAINGVRGKTYFTLGDMESCLLFANKAILGYTELKDTNGLITELSNVGVFYERLGQDSMAMARYNEGMSLLKKTSPVDSDKLANLLHNMAALNTQKGHILMDTSYIMKSLEQYRLVVEIDRKSGHPEYASQTYNNIGLCFQGIAYITQQPVFYDSAMVYYHRSAGLKKKLNDQDGLSLAYSNMGKVLEQSGQLDSARTYRELSLKYAWAANAGEPITLALEGMVMQNEAEGHLEEALSYAKRLRNFKDSMIYVQTGERIAEMQARYDNVRKEMENSQLRAENSERELDLERSEKKRIYLISTLGVLLVVGILVFVWLRERQKGAFIRERTAQQKLRFKSVIEAEEKERVRIARDLHDGIGQMLTATQLNLDGLDEPNDPEDLEQMNKAKSLLTESTKEIRRISHAMMPAILIEYGLVKAIETLTANLRQSGLIEIQFNHNVPEKSFEQAEEIALYRVVQEVTNNMVRHAQAKNIFIELKKENGKVALTITDDGLGFDTSKIQDSQGLGWKNILSRLSLIDGRLDVSSNPGKGTRIHIHFNSASNG